MPRRPWTWLLTLTLLLLPLSVHPTAGAAQDDPLQATTRTVNIELILDASGSMAEALPEGVTRMDVAKRILRDVIAALPEREGVSVGLRVYGHLGDNTEAGKAVSCRASELLVPVAGLDKAALIQQIESIQPTGWTPIAYALQQAAADFQPGGESITNAIVLVTDGEETCDPPEQSCQAAGALHQGDVTVTTHVVGFALTPQQTELVRCVAEQGGGQLFGADNAQQLGSALDAAIQAAGVTLTPVPLTPIPAAAPLADVRTLAYHQLTAWSAGVNDRGEEAPILSEDGQRIAFARAPGAAGDPANPNRIFVIDADGAGEREVDAYSPLCNCGSIIDINGDGSRIVSTDLVQVRLADGNGGGGRELLALDSGEINAVRISADGSVIVFRIYRDTTIRGTSPSEPIQRGVYAINPDGSGLRQVAGPDDIATLLGVTPEQAGFFGGSSGIDVSANGAQIVFAVFVPPVAGGTGGESLFAVNFDGSGLRQLITASNVPASAISGDGARVAYVTYDGATGRQEAGVLGFDGSGQRMLTDSTSLHPGTGYNLPSGERIQLSRDGSRLLLGSTGLLYDTASGQALALGVGVPGGPGDPAPLVIDGLLRATMDAAATRALYLFQPFGQPYQLARVDLNPADLGGGPAIADPRVSPPYVLTEGRSTATVSARVSGDPATLWVSSRVLRDGIPDGNTFSGRLVDDGATGGDATAQVGLFSGDGLATDCCAVVGPRTVRIQAETRSGDGRQLATAVDIGPFQVATTPVEGGPAPTATLPAGGDAAAQATIAAQATLIATLQAPGGTTPTPPPTAPPPTLPPATVPPATVPATTAPPVMTPLTTPPAVTPLVTPPSTPPAAAFVTPDPTECTVTPRTAESLAALAAAPDRAAADAFAAARARPGLDVLPGTPADAATRTAVEAFYRLMTACFNAGNELAAYALWSDDALRPFPIAAPNTPPTPLPQGERMAFQVTEVRLLPDGRVAVTWDQLGYNLSASLAQILIAQNGGYLVDETVDIAFPATGEAASSPSPAP